METTLENFTRKTCYGYFQVYDIILICSLFVRILYFNYMLYYKKKRIGNIVKIAQNKCHIYNELS
jgi:hypothetical protein